MTITYHRDLIQGTDEWLEARRGLITASEMSLILTPKTMKAANNEKVRAHVYELAAQRISGYVEPHYISDDMLRGQDEEQIALSRYHQEVAEVQYCGFVTNDEFGFTLGYSPDALVGDAGLVECKSRRQKYQIQTICESLDGGSVTGIPVDYVLQCQTGLLVTGREWLDFISYCGGLPMMVARVWPDETIHTAILEACETFEDQIAKAREKYENAMASYPLLFATERTEREIVL